MISKDPWVHISLTLIYELFALQILMLKAICTMLLFIPSVAYPVSAKSISSFLSSCKVKPISSIWIKQLFPMPFSPHTYSNSWSSLITQSLLLFQIMWSRNLLTTRPCRVFSSKTAWIWLAIPLQSRFAGEILYKDCDDERSRRLELVKTGLRAPVADMGYIKA